ncbi:MAG: hypothetical protein U0X34_05990 [Bacteroidia bacterium]
MSDPGTGGLAYDVRVHSDAILMVLASEFFDQADYIFEPYPAVS